MLGKWQYRIEKFPVLPEDDVNGLKNMMDQLGSEGWEFVETTGSIGSSGLVGNKMIFKRQIIPQSTNQTNR